MKKSNEDACVTALTFTAGASAILYLIFDRMITGVVGIEGWPTIAANICIFVFTICLAIGAISSFKELIRSHWQDQGALTASIILSASSLVFIALSCMRFIASI